MSPLPDDVAEARNVPGHMRVRPHCRFSAEAKKARILAADPHGAKHPLKDSRASVGVSISQSVSIGVRGRAVHEGHVEGLGLRCQLGKQIGWCGIGMAEASFGLKVVRQA